METGRQNMKNDRQKEKFSFCRKENRSTRTNRGQSEGEETRFRSVSLDSTR